MYPKRGIDYSALVWLIYQDHMEIQLPHTSQYQVVAGEAIKQ